MCVISEEAIETFGEDRTIILSNATRDDINSNIEKIITRFDEMDAGIEQ